MQAPVQGVGGDTGRGREGREPGVDQRPLVGVVAAHAAQVAAQGARAQEVGQRRLDRLADHGAPGLPCGAHGRGVPVGVGGGQDDVPAPQPGVEHLGEAADVQHHAAGVEGGQGRHRVAAVAELAVVVVLDDRRAELVRDLEQPQATCERHHRPHRVLVRGRDRHDVGAGRDGLRVQALVVDGDRDQGAAGARDRPPAAVVAGVLDGHDG